MVGLANMFFVSLIYNSQGNNCIVFLLASLGLSCFVLSMNSLSVSSTMTPLTSSLSLSAGNAVSGAIQGAIRGGLTAKEVASMSVVIGSVLFRFFSFRTTRAVLDFFFLVTWRRKGICTYYTVLL